MEPDQANPDQGPLALAAGETAHEQNEADREQQALDDPRYGPRLAPMVQLFDDRPLLWPARCDELSSEMLALRGKGDAERHPDEPQHTQPA
jgi:hypothetical protein